MAVVQFQVDRLQAPLYMSEECTCSSSALDLAALEEGRLSSPGLRRLSAHVPTCRTCTAVVLASIEDSLDAESVP